MALVADPAAEKQFNLAKPSIQFGENFFFPVGDAALYWPSQKSLLVADLHLEKASSYALTGQMLPPYDSLATLQELECMAKLSGARSVICLGDNFHDDAGEARLQGEAAQLLGQMTQYYDWIWVVGNHDPGLSGKWGGTTKTELNIDGIMLRHDAKINDEIFEISGHYHPKIRIGSRGRSQSRRCFVKLEYKLVMPAFGALTGGMDAQEVARIIGSERGTNRQQSDMALVAHRSGLSRFALNI